MKRFFVFIVILFWLMFWVFSQFSHASNIIEEVTSDDIKNKTWGENWIIIDTWGSASGIKDLLQKVWMKIMMPIVILIAVLIAILWFYKMMFSEKDEEQKSWRQFLTWWVLWILIMWAALFITNIRVWEGWLGWDFVEYIYVTEEWNWAVAAEKLYGKIILPFVKIALYLAVWVLFWLLLIHSLKYLSNPKEDMKNNSKRIIIWNIIWIIIIMLSKTIVEALYWKAEDVAKSSTDTWVWVWLLEGENLVMVYSIINRLLSFVSFLVLWIIIYQCYLLISKPNDTDIAWKLKKNFIYITIWIMFIWTSYLISNFILFR